jgi:hypothetical protein
VLIFYLISSDVEFSDSFEECSNEITNLSEERSLKSHVHSQASLLARYPAGLSVTAYSYLFGGAFMCIVGSFVATNPSDWALTRSEIFAVFYAVGCFIFR